ncbi:hypothetical protein Hdeb2414_s0008g00286901 [Helianthus debilis subsp. tardiflorus]
MGGCEDPSLVACAGVCGGVLVGVEDSAGVVGVAGATDITSSSAGYASKPTTRSADDVTDSLESVSESRSESEEMSMTETTCDATSKITTSKTSPSLRSSSAFVLLDFSNLTRALLQGILIRNQCC